MKRIILAIFTGILLIPFSFAHADTTKDFETISKALGFITNGPSGSVTMDILYNPNNPESLTHANEVMELVSGGIGTKVILTGRKISAAEDATSKIIFVTRGTRDMYGSVLNKAATNGGLTISTDETCLGTGCVLVVKTVPNVDIIVSNAAAAKTGTSFSSAFSMMITKR